MVGWKKTVFQAAAFGAAFALVLCVVGVAWIWYANSPHPTAWNSTAIRATFKDITLSTSQQPPKEHFSYLLENTTDVDYSLDKLSSLLNNDPKMIRSPDALAKIRADRAKQAQAAQQADIAQKLSQGAKNLAGADMGGGQNLLQHMAGGPQ